MEWEELEPIVRQFPKYRALPEKLQVEALKQCEEKLPGWKAKFDPKRGKLISLLMVASMGTVTVVAAKHRRKQREALQQ